MDNSISKPPQWSVRIGFLADRVADQYKFKVSPAMRCAGFERFCADTDTDRCCLTLFALGEAQCALITVIALKTQKNENIFLKKYKFAPPTILPAPP